MSKWNHLQCVTFPTHTHSLPLFPIAKGHFGLNLFHYSKFNEDAKNFFIHWNRLPHHQHRQARWMTFTIREPLRPRTQNHMILFIICSQILSLPSSVKRFFCSLLLRFDFSVRLIWLMTLHIPMQRWWCNKNDFLFNLFCEISIN